MPTSESRQRRRHVDALGPRNVVFSGSRKSRGGRSASADLMKHAATGQQMVP